MFYWETFQNGPTYPTELKPGFGDKIEKGEEVYLLSKIERQTVHRKRASLEGHPRGPAEKFVKFLRSCGTVRRYRLPRHHRITVISSMAILGVHVVVSLIALTILSKFRGRFSLSTIFLKGLFRYLPPSNELLREAARIPALNSRGRRRKQEQAEREAKGFKVPKDSDFNLYVTEVRGEDLEQLPFYEHLVWLVDFIFFALLVATISEGFKFFFPGNQDVNISVVWLVIGVAFILHTLAKLTSAMLFSPEVEAERNLIICFAAVYFLGSLVFVMSCDKWLDIEFVDAFESLIKRANEFLRSQNVAADALLQTRSPLLLYMTLSAMFSFTASMLVFPNFRYATMYSNALKVDSAATKFLLHITFLLPVFTLLLFTQPAHNYLVNGPRKLLDEHQLDTLRLWAVVVWALLRLALRRVHLQSHLDLALERVTSMRKETGNINSLDLQRMIFRYFSYFCAAALQYFIPVVLPLILSFLLASLGNVSWIGLPASTEVVPEADNMASLNVLISANVQHAFWKLCLVFTVLVNTSITFIGFVYNSYLNA
uniref:Transmembrane protein 16H n=1 Tax=Steinernema glaseri TaxID=37863 RepID=A0A1I8AG37_9BILA